MNHTDPLQSQRDAQWRSVSRLFWLALGLSAALALAAEMLQRLQLLPPTVSTGVGALDRTWLYVGLLYLVAVPVLFLRMRGALAGYPVPWHPPRRRLLLGALAVVICAGLMLLPLIVLLAGADASGRGQSLYRLFVNSVVGTGLVGAVLGYGVAMAAWLLFCGTPQLLSARRGPC